ncbi:uncharacterized protein Z519_06075 [Cladophialophora bantiana CBS 173.52]|uniref:Uncharacterized protein n=1 Tax=Cladophialophora bantiana (strain ATCC 10958 / CBS 173.52 / CDC B-1940 / NIH 8579) TaxID=1442370 RepID=A0A0D2HRK7_CLAB1|nr:uncharacterized protein Z519_06075 [Cladophialophora bantiana CBS 173.52]KIW93470.1 hypothetical protein Z519_06075 [Cladophialophora bantiana CBS 173.52]
MWSTTPTLAWTGSQLQLDCGLGKHTQTAPAALYKIPDYGLTEKPHFWSLGRRRSRTTQAPQREFRAVLASVVEANVVPSENFIAAVEQALDNTKRTMATNCFESGSRM